MAVISERAAVERRAGQRTAATGSFRCAGCGHTATVIRTLPECEHCAGSEWVAAPWSPFSKARG
jgi:hypothetical protein